MARQVQAPQVLETGAFQPKEGSTRPLRSLVEGAAEWTGARRSTIIAIRFAANPSSHCPARQDRNGVVSYAG